jgi:hypothetical protein
MVSPVWESLLFFEEDDMSRKLFFFGAIAFLCAALFLIGCPTDADDDLEDVGNTGETGGGGSGGGSSGGGSKPGGGNQNPPTQITADELAGQLADIINLFNGGGSAVASGTTVTLSGIKSIPSGKFIDVPQGVTLEVAAKATLTVENGGKLIAQTNGLKITEGGFLVVANGATVKLGGQELGPGTWNYRRENIAKNFADSLGDGVELGNDGTVKVTGPLPISGNFIVPAGVKLSVSGSINVPSRATLIVEDGASVELSGGTLNVEDGGGLEVGQGGEFNVASGNLNVKDGGRLNVVEGGKLEVSGGGLKVEDDGELNVQGNGTIKVTAGNLNVEDNSRLNIEGNGKLDVTSGTLKVDGTLKMSGAAGITVSGGTFNIGVNADGNRVNGDITIEDGATLAFDDGNQHFTGSGHTIFKAGGKMTQELGGPVSIVGGIDSGAVLELESGEFKANAGEFILNGNATLKGDNNKKYLIGQSQTMEVNGELTVADQVTFIVRGTELTIGQGGKLEGAGANAKIIIMTEDGVDGKITGNGAPTFYNNSNAETPPVINALYKWKTDKWDRS